MSVVVTLAEGEPLATTAGSVAAASWNPPLLAGFSQTGSRMAVALNNSPRFTVNVLGETGSGLARRFARPDRKHGWAALSDIGLVHRDQSPPVLSGAIAWADCAVTQTVPIGDHHCYIGQVLELDRHHGMAPLVSYRGRLRGLGTAVAPATWAASDAAGLAAVW